jgi:preprotein translocase subunit SecD
MFGTGPIKGFAVTLAIGIIINLFTAVFGSKTIFDWILVKYKPRSLSI